MEKTEFQTAASCACAGDDNGNNAVNRGMISALAQFFHYLLTLDDYTLGIIGRMCLRWHENKELNILELSREHGCSRQAMHRKILSIIAENPELTAMFTVLLPKLSDSRRKFLEKKAMAVSSIQ